MGGQVGTGTRGVKKSADDVWSRLDTTTTVHDHPDPQFYHRMANTSSASKRARQTAVRSRRNRSVITRLRNMQKRIAHGQSTPVAKEVQAMISAIDKAAKWGVIHRNAAKRRKARLNRLLTAVPRAAAVETQS